MSKKPLTSEQRITIRMKVRDVLRAVPKERAIPAGMITDGLRALGYAVGEEDRDEAIEWNHSRNFIDYKHNYDFDRDEWFLTEKGRKHE